MIAQNKQRELITSHLKEADEDIDSILNEFDQAKDDQET
jgi:hypothetical protein